ncbi:hypothetical protein [Flavobacterium sp. WC2509]|uniref:hypothetical protein n=1 Tax=Flavobacterium sp. WC2509 TaxID=3461406 RepID=UPI004043CCE8
MKSKFLFLLLFVSSFGFSQSVNDFSAVIVPLKYDFLRSENQYRLSTLTKLNLQKAGFKVFYANESFFNGYNDRCNLLNVDVLKENGFLVTKLYVVLKDCNGKEIFKSEIGKSREKEFDVAYAEALNAAFKSVYALNYKYNGTVIASNNSKATILEPTVKATAAAASMPSSAAQEGTVLFAQPIKNGYQLVDSTPKVVMKMYKTANPSIYLGVKENIQGAVVLKENQWYFEYYENDNFISDKIAIKF